MGPAAAVSRIRFTDRKSDRRAFFGVKIKLQISTADLAGFCRVK